MQGQSDEPSNGKAAPNVSTSDELARATALLSAKLLEGLNSGKPIPFDDDYIPSMKRRIIARISKRKPS